MVEWTITVLKESLLGSLGIIRMLVLIIIPMMIFIQIMMDYKWLEMLSGKTKRITGFLGVSKETLIPLLIGIFAGVSYGAGAIFFAKEKYDLGKNDIFLSMCFLLPLHGIIDSSFIFYWMLGVNPAAVLLCRFCAALSGTLLLKKYMSKRRSEI